METTHSTNGVHHQAYDAGIPHPDQVPEPAPLKTVPVSVPAPEGLASPTPASTAVDDEPLSPPAQAPPAGIEDLATLPPLTDPSRQYDDALAQVLHFGGEQAATAAGDVRLDDPVAPTAGEGVPTYNADLEMQVDDPPPPLPEPVEPAVDEGMLPQQNGDPVPAHSGDGLLPSAPPAFPGIDDEPAPFSPSVPSQPVATSPSTALKRPLSPAPLDEEALVEPAKRQKLTPSPVLPPAAPISPPAEADPPLVRAPALDSPLVQAPAPDSPPVQAPALDSLAQAPALDSPLVQAPALDSPLVQAPSQSPLPPAPALASESPMPLASSMPPPPQPEHETETEEMILDDDDDDAVPAAVDSLEPAPAPLPAVAEPSAPPLPPATADAAAATTTTETVKAEDVKAEEVKAEAAREEEDHMTRTRVMPGTSGATKLSKDQHRFLRNVLTQLKRHRCQAPFANPVDPVALGIPHYPQYVKKPMDLHTIEDKLGKLDKSNLAGSLYRSADEFIADVRLVWQNCYTFNGTEAQISKMAKEMSDTFEGYLKKLPPDEPPHVPTPPAPTAVPAPPKSASPAAAMRRPSVSGGAPTIRRNSSDNLHRPKREIKAPEKDLPYFAEQAEREAARPKARRQSTATAPAMVPNTVQELRFCREVIKELNSKKHQLYAWPFYDPVDPVAMNLPDYFKIIKKPMDLSTIKSKVDRGDYKNGAAFAADVRLMFNNCFTYNPQGQDVYGMGKQLEKVFETKWLDRPPERVAVVPQDEEDEEELAKKQTLRDQIAELQAQLQQAEKTGKPKKIKAAKTSPKAAKPRTSNGGGGASVSRPKHVHSHSTSSAGHRPRKSISYRDDDFDYDGSDDNYGGGGRTGSKARGGADGDDDYDIISYEQKKELATRIQDAQEPMQTHAINVIKQNRPDLVSADGEEIELDIDALDDRTLYKLFRLVCAPGKGRKQKKHPRPDSARLTASGSLAKKSGRAGTGGPKRQGLDENREAARIAELQSQLQAFEGGGGPGAGAVGKPSQPEYASSSSDSESESDSD